MACLVLAGACGRSPGGTAGAGSPTPTASSTVPVDISPAPASPTSSTTPRPSACTSSARPSPREGGAFAYDAASGQAYLFGGFGPNHQKLNDTWRLNGQCWSKLTPALSPPASVIVAWAFDQGAGRLVVVLYGGNPETTDLSTWTWNGSNWASDGPGPDMLAGQASYDPTSKRILLFGFANGGASQTWAWNESSWSRLSPAISPEARYNASMAYDPATHRVMLFGGISPTGAEIHRQWFWDGSTWTAASPKIVPPARQLALLVSSAATRRAILVGGLGSDGNALADAWSWDGTNWSQMPGIGPSIGAMAVDEGSNVVLFGGGDDSSVSDKTLLWNGLSWSPS